jgi:hypothetical protein
MSFKDMCDLADTQKKYFWIQLSIQLHPHRTRIDIDPFWRFFQKIGGKERSGYNTIKGKPRKMVAKITGFDYLYELSDKERSLAFKRARRL